MDKKRGYITFEKEQLEGNHQIIYCNNHKNDRETDEEIMRAITSCFYDYKFNANEHLCLNGGGIKNDDRLHVLTDISGIRYIWQSCGCLTDMEGVVIPNAYLVRKIGMVVQS